MAGLLLLLLHPLLLLSHAPHCSPHQISERSFRRLVAAAQRCQRPLRLKGRTVELLEGLSLSSSLPLTIAGPGTIASEGHAVFTVGGNRQRLELTGPALRIVHRASAARIGASSVSDCCICTLSSATLSYQLVKSPRILTLDRPDKSSMKSHFEGGAHAVSEFEEASRLGAHTPLP